VLEWSGEIPRPGALKLEAAVVGLAVVIGLVGAVAAADALARALSNIRPRPIPVAVPVRR
jgi:hypothetical protein